METILIIAVIGIIVYLYNKKDDSSSNRSQTNNSYQPKPNNSYIHSVVQRENNAKNMMRKVFGDAILKTHNENPMSGTPLEGYPILETLNSVNDFFIGKIPTLSIQYNLSKERIRELIRDVYREIYDKVFTN
ncbi:MAG TPA: hypothetical protein DIT04_09365 [Dysgonomonas sp.]|nr:hypothetical protein [Dysgonomonas sp.]